MPTHTVGITLGLEPALETVGRAVLHAAQIEQPDL